MGDGQQLLRPIRRYHEAGATWLRIYLMGKEPAIGVPDAQFQADAGMPAERLQFAAVHELSWRAVRLRQVVNDAPFEARHPCHQLGKLKNREVLPAAHVDVLGG